MGALEIHAELVGTSTTDYLGQISAPKDYTLFHLLGASGFKRYAALTDGTTPPRCRSHPGLPERLSAALAQRLPASEAREEGAWRWMMRDELLRIGWNAPLLPQRIFLGPAGFSDLQAGRRPRRSMPVSDEGQARLARFGSRVVSHAEMARYLAENPDIVERDPGEHTARICTIHESTQTVAESLGFTEALQAIRALPGADACRLSLWIEA